MRRYWMAFPALALLATTAAAVNPNYDPQWRPGDSWRVRFTLKLYTNRADGQPRDPGTDTDFTYSYRVVPAASSPSNVLRIRAHSEDGDSDWVLSFDKSTLTLMGIDEAVSKSRIHHRSPFANDAWMANLHQFARRIIHDYARIPNTDTDETRAISAAGSGTPAFTQSVTFSPGTATVVMRRPDPATSLEHKTTLVWNAGEKWWSTAVIELGADVVVRGELVR